MPGAVTGFELKADEDTMAVTEEDASRRLPHPVPFDPGRPGGLGWVMVQRLARDVQVGIAASGKRVSAVMPLSTDPRAIRLDTAR